MQFQYYVFISGVLSVIGLSVKSWQVYNRYEQYLKSFNNKNNIGATEWKKCKAHFWQWL